MTDEPNHQDLPPAYFLSISLENVRCFGPEQTLDLSDDEGRPAQWTVLLGDNGTGKTTVLQAIAAMEPGSIDQEREDILGSAPRWIWDLKIGNIWNAVRRSQEGKNVGRKVPVKIGTDFFVGAEMVDSSGGERIEGFRCQKFEGVRPSVMKTESVGEIIDHVKCLAYGAGRSMATGAFEEKDESGTRTLFDDEAELPNANEWLLQTDYAAKSGKPKAERRLRQIKKILAGPESGILPDVDDLRFAEQEGETSPPRVEFHTPYGWVTIDEISLGYRTMIAWVVDLARRLFKRYPDSENPLAEPAVCLVDEIDLHLHPKWQRKIIDFLGERFPNTQFVVTAHSPLVVQAAQDANVAVLRREENPDGDDYVVIDNDPARIRNWRIDQILTSDLFGLESARPPQLDDLMEEREEILAQSELTEEDEKRLEEIEEEIGDLPTGETPDDIEAMNLIRKAARRLRGQSTESA